jgi:hypothetical protein
VQLSSDFSDKFKAFEDSLNLPDPRLTSINVSANIPTHTPDSFLQEEKNYDALFDPERGSKHLTKSYEASRQEYKGIYDMVNQELDNEQLFKQYGNETDQQAFEEITKLYEEIIREKRLATPSEQEQFKQWGELKKELLQRKVDREEKVKMAMGRSLISGQAMQHLKWLNSAYGQGFDFNPANAFEMQGKQLTTTVEAKGTDFPFKIRTDASHPGKIQIQSYLALKFDKNADSNTVELGNPEHFEEIHYIAPGETELFTAMISAYQKEGSQLLP